ncbi:MAG: alpha/beta hydrolase [Sporichthyaceae bacterium]
MRAALAAATPAPVGDHLSRRLAVEGFIRAMFAALEPAPGVISTEHAATSADGAQVSVRLFTPPRVTSPALVIYVHGGGMILGSVDLYDPRLRLLAARWGVRVLAVDYRLAPEHPHPAPVEDCYAALAWAAANAPAIGIDATRIALVGESAGGGLAAGVTLLARARGGPAIARQILLYPMLDDRTRQAPGPLPEILLWTYADNITGWGALLGDAAGGAVVPACAAPARALDLAGLPPAYLVVGDIDIFAREDLAYAARLSAAGVPTEFHLLPGAPHAYDFLAPEAGISKRTWADIDRLVRAL